MTDTSDDRDRNPTREPTDAELELGRRLRQVRRGKRLSLLDVERRTGDVFRASVLGAYERCERAITVHRLIDLATFYEVPVRDLLPERDEAESHVVTVALSVVGSAGDAALVAVALAGARIVGAVTDQTDE